MDNETPLIFFCECYKPGTLHKQILGWCDSLGINLPDMNPSNILYEILPLHKQNILLNNLIVAFESRLHQISDIASLVKF